MNEIKDIKEHLAAAREAIDGRVRCDSPEYAALDMLERALDLLTDKVAKIDTEIWRIMNPNP